MKHKFQNWLCNQYNDQGWAFRYPILTPIFFRIHEKTCLDNPSDVMNEEEFMAYLETLISEGEKKKKK